jgi:hypothetical protein
MNVCFKVASLAAMAASVFLIPAVAADETPQRLGDAWKSALLGAEPVLTPQQFAKLNNLAYQSAAVRVCEGFEINAEKFNAAIADATAPAKDDLSDEEFQVHQSFVLIEFGMRYGLFLAEGKAQDKSFCANAAELKTKTEIPNIWE